MKFKNLLIAIAALLVVGCLNAQNQAKQIQIKESENPTIGIENYDRLSTEERTPKGKLLVSKGTSLSYKTLEEFNQSKKVVLCDDNFEQTSNLWINNKFNWQVGSNSVRSLFGTNSTSFIGTNFTSNYHNNQSLTFESKTIKLPEHATIIISYKEWFQIESDYDFGIVKVSQDDGNTWETISYRTGKTEDWVNSKINISQYSGLEIKLSFQLVSDESFNYSGWFIDDFLIEYSEKDPLEVEIQSLSTQNFPLIFSNVNVNYLGAGINTLTQSNFQVFENGTLQTELFQVTPPEQSSGSKIVDIVICMDISGSMDGEIAQVSSNLTNFVLALEQQGIEQYGLGLVIMNGTSPYVCNSGQLVFNNAQYFLQNVWKGIPGIYNYPNGREVGLDAMVTATNSFNFVAPQKIVIMITDEGPSANSNWGNYSTQQTINILNDGGFNGYCLIESSDYGVIQEYGEVGIQTNGNWFNILSPFDEILDAIVEQVSNSYEVRYKSNDENCNGINREVNIIVNHEGYTANDIFNYLPCEAPTIERTPETISLSDQSWFNNSELTIGVEVIDNHQPYVNNVTLHYKNTNDLNYSSISMVNTQGDIWEKIIPLAAVQEPGVDYYITATDGQTNVSTPQFNPSENPWQIAITPNYSPLILHQPIETATPNQPIAVEAFITDVTNDLNSAWVYYRKYGNILYTPVEMEGFSDDYIAYIPQNIVTEDGVEYYIYAEDNFGVGSYHGTSDDPHFIDCFNFWESHLNNGIALQIIETAKSKEKIVKYVGFRYHTATDLFWQTKAFPVLNDGYVFLEHASKAWYSLSVTFDDEIFLWDANPMTKQNANQIGHINFDYNFNWESDFARHAIIYFHNDSDMCDGGYFPYGSDNPDFPEGNRKWNYFQEGEYPVSMLIPPYYWDDPANSGYKMPEEFDKKPILFVHGLNGTFGYSDPCTPEDDEVSYWFNTERIVNRKYDENGNFKYHGWQFYYPNTMDIYHASFCLENAIENYLSPKYEDKVNIVTHSMGGLVTLEYLTLNDTIENQDNIGKVLLSVPPIHGSYGANKAYKTGLGSFVELVSDQDRDAPCMRDMSLSSDFMWNLHDRDWASKLNFNNSDGDHIYDDIFVLIGSTRKNFGVSNVAHQEAEDHNDGIVSISSASLIDHGIGFATINGNHDDGRFTISNLNDINILPDIIESYFNDMPTPQESWEFFRDGLMNNNEVHAVYSSDPEDQEIIKPVGSTLANLETTESDVDYQKGIVCFEQAGDASAPLYTVERLGNNILLLKQSWAQAHLTPNSNYSKFNKNPNASNSSVSRFYGLFDYIYVVPDIHDLGVGLKYPNSTLTLLVCDAQGNPEYNSLKQFDFSNCKSHYIDVPGGAGGGSWKDDDFLANNLTDVKFSLFNPGDKSTIYIDDQTSAVEFVFYSEDSWVNNQSFVAKLMMPDNTVIDSSSTQVTWINQHDVWMQKFIINNPMAGAWKLWAETETMSNDTSMISISGKLETNLIAYKNMNNSHSNINQNFNIEAGLAIEDKLLLDDLVATATVYKPNFQIETIDLDDLIIETDSGFIYRGLLNVTSSGVYGLKINFEGKYGEYNFERALWHQIEFFDSTPSLNMPDLFIDSIHNYHEIIPFNYSNNVYRDSVIFSAQVIDATIDTSTYFFSYDTIVDQIFVTSDLSETGYIEIEVQMFLNSGEIIPDTMKVFVDNGIAGQEIELKSNWSIISSYQNPDTPQLETIFADQIANNTLAIMLGKSGIFWPGYGINTIGDWNSYEGYKLKMIADDQVIISGEMVENKTLTLPAGVSYMPVLSVTPISATEVFNQISGKLLYAFDIQDQLVYWPEGEIYTLSTLEPGRGYLVNMLEEGTVTFPESVKSAGVNTPIEIQNAPWSFNKTGMQHLISISTLALNELEPGDIIGVFNANGVCTGMSQYQKAGENLALVVWGDDFTTDEVDGMIAGEQMNLVAYSPITGEENTLTPVWNKDINPSNLFAENGVSMISSFKSATSLDESNFEMISIYPNPNNGLFMINGINTMVELQIINSTGQLIQSMSTEKSVEIDLSNYARGIYYLKLVSQGNIKVEKLIVK